MEVSFSVPTWKANQILNIDLKLEQYFYASTPYNLNDFKSNTKIPQPIFQLCQQNQPKFQPYLKKQLIKRQQISVAIFITYFYDFITRIRKIIETNNKLKQIIAKPVLLQQPIKINNKDEILEPKQSQTQRRLVSSPQKRNESLDFQILKGLKMKIYQIDLCKLQKIPQKFQKYYNNNLIKKIIFQYLTKSLHNISLVQILLQCNQFLCFAISLISQSLSRNKQLITSYNQSIQFKDQAVAFFQHFQTIEFQSTISSSQMTSYEALKQNKISKNQKSQKKNQFNQNFNHFVITKKSIKGNFTQLKIQDSLKDSKVFIYIYDQHKIKKRQQNYSSKIKNYQKNQKNQKSKKSIPSVKSIKLKNINYIKPQKQQKGWFKYLGCLKYFFIDNPKK